MLDIKGQPQKYDTPNHGTCRLPHHQSGRAVVLKLFFFFVISITIHESIQMTSIINEVRLVQFVYTAVTHLARILLEPPQGTFD